MKRVLAPGGVIATQGECLWLHLPLIKSVMNACTEVFASVDYAFTTVPSYPSGQIGFILASTEERGNNPLLQPAGAVGCRAMIACRLFWCTVRSIANTLLQALRIVGAICCSASLQGLILMLRSITGDGWSNRYLACCTCGVVWCSLESPLLAEVREINSRLKQKIVFFSVAEGAS